MLGPLLHQKLKWYVQGYRQAFEEIKESRQPVIEAKRAIEEYERKFL